jgi:hypothetical protein
MSISIGITETQARSLSHYGEITELASEMKKFAKQSKGSCFRSDRRMEPKVKAKRAKKNNEER